MQRQKRDSSATVIRGGARWSADEARQILDEWAMSGDSLHAFAQQRGLEAQRLRWWQKRLAGRPRRPIADRAAIATAPAFLPVTVGAIEQEANLATVEIADGLRVELRALDGASAAWVASLVKALGAAT